MATYYPFPVQCNNCDHQFEAQLAKGINAGRTPKIKQQIIDGIFHKTVCPSCNTSMDVEKEFSYTDFTTNTFIKVKPRQERHLWREASLDLEREISDIPDTISDSSSRQYRVVFGLAELREKLIAEQHLLDDRSIELLKVLIINDHPFLLNKARIRIMLNCIDEQYIEFIVAYDHDRRRFVARVPRWLVEGLISDPEAARNWVSSSHSKDNIFNAGGEHWVNMWRWSPQPDALKKLQDYAAKLRADPGSEIDTKEESFQTMLSDLPTGSHLPAWAKGDLQLLFDYARRNTLNDIQDRLFEIKFDKKLEDEWATNNNRDDIATLWQLMDNLPDDHAEGNIFINEIFLEGSGGLYNPKTHDIYIGSELLSNKESFEDTVRHEVGHAVHEKYSDLVNDWLREDLGWEVFEGNTEGINGWVKAMGGWGTCTPQQQSQIRQYITNCLGKGSSWNQGSPGYVPLGQPWRAGDFGPRIAFEKTGNNWFRNYRTWCRIGDKAFFMNYWYRTLYAVKVSTLAMIDKMPKDYAAMSHFEFFAELYALYFDSDDKQRDNIPAAVMQWFDENINITKVLPRPAHPSQPVKKDYETVTRPGSPQNENSTLPRN